MDMKYSFNSRDYGSCNKQQLGVQNLGLSCVYTFFFAEIAGIANIRAGVTRVKY